MSILLLCPLFLSLLIVYIGHAPCTAHIWDQPISTNSWFFFWKLQSTEPTIAIFCRSQAVYPLVVAAHPQEPNQFAVGLTDGSVKVMEPSESEGKWGLSPPVDNGMLNGRTASSSNTSNHTPDQAQRWDLLYSK